jgi:hypothetical protein
MDCLEGGKTRSRASVIEAFLSGIYFGGEMKPIENDYEIFDQLYTESDAIVRTDK